MPWRDLFSKSLNNVISLNQIALISFYKYINNDTLCLIS